MPATVLKNYNLPVKLLFILLIDQIKHILLINMIIVKSGREPVSDVFTLCQYVFRNHRQIHR